MDASGVNEDAPVNTTLREPSKSEGDSDYDTDLEDEVSTPAYDISGRQLYLESCEKLGVVAAKYFMSHMKDESLNMSHHGLGPMGTIALCFPLEANTFITDIDLSDNFIGPEGVAAVCWMLRENVYVTRLNLHGNKIGSRGAKFVAKMLLQNLTLIYLDISCNEITDRDGPALAGAIAENKCLTYLNLSHNMLGTQSAAALGSALQENDSLVKLDLSWNHFRYRSSIPICKFVKANATLRTLDLSFLGLGKEGGTVLSDALCENTVLQELAINDCRLGTEAAVGIAKMLAINTTLVLLGVKNNNFDVPSAIAILVALSKNPQTALTLIDLGSMEVTKEFVDKQNELADITPVVVKRGKLIGDYEITGKYIEERTMFGLKIPEFDSACPLTALRNYALEHDVEDFHELVDRLMKKRLHKIDALEITELAKLPEFKLSFDQQNVFDARILAMADSEQNIDVTIFHPSAINNAV